MPKKYVTTEEMHHDNIEPRVTETHTINVKMAHDEVNDNIMNLIMK